jgi:hypothetical protein
VVILLIIVASAVFLALTLILTKPTALPEEKNTIIFRYQAGRSALLIFCVPWSAIFVVVFYIMMPSKPNGYDLVPYVVTGSVPTIAFLVASRYIQAFTILANDKCLRIFEFGSPKDICYGDIKAILLKRGFGRSGDQLSLLGERDKRLLTLGDGFEDLYGFVALVRSRTKNLGTVYKQRDKFGHWS